MYWVTVQTVDANTGETTNHLEIPHPNPQIAAKHLYVKHFNDLFRRPDLIMIRVAQTHSLAYFDFLSERVRLSLKEELDEQTGFCEICEIEPVEPFTTDKFEPAFQLGKFWIYQRKNLKRLFRENVNICEMGRVVEQVVVPKLFAWPLFNGTGDGDGAVRARVFAFM